MVMGSMPPLAIFIVMSSEVVDLHTCTCIHASHHLDLCTHRLRTAAVPPWLATDPVSGSVNLVSPVFYRMTRSLATPAVFELGHKFLSITVWASSYCPSHCIEP